jgi:hypothetical protein
LYFQPLKEEWRFRFIKILQILASPQTLKAAGQKTLNLKKRARKEIYKREKGGFLNLI